MEHKKPIWIIVLSMRQLWRIMKDKSIIIIIIIIKFSVLFSGFYNPSFGEEKYWLYVSSLFLPRFSSYISSLTLMVLS